MLNSIRKLLSPPVFEGNQEKTRIAGQLNSILLFVTITSLIALPFLTSFTESSNRLPILFLVLSAVTVEIIAYLFMRRGQVTLASNLFLLTLGVSVLGSYAFSTPGSAGATLSLTILIAFTTLLRDARAILRLIAFIIAFTLFIIFAQDHHWITPALAASTNPISNWVSNSFALIIAGLGLYLSSLSLKRALDSSLSAQVRLQKSNQDLDELRKELEQHVAERTSALDRRASQLQTISDLARAIASVQDVETLLPYITNLVSARFGFYHAGIFLIDEAREFAVLSAANSEGGQRMLNREHKLRLDNNSIVGYVTSHGEPRIALDVGADAVYFNNPDLPNTRSEMALPLRISDHTIGALDVQSEQPNAFVDEDIATLTILGDQIAIAIENARLFSAARMALNESEQTFEQYVKQQWSTFANQLRSTGYVFDGNRTSQYVPRGPRERVKSVAQTGRLSLEKESNQITVPIRFRGQTVGVLEVKSKKNNRQWTRDELTLLESAAERAALALENARLVESAQRRASRERAIGEIASRIGAVSDVDSIMQAAVEELGRKIGGAMEVSIELGDRDGQVNV